MLAVVDFQPLVQLGNQKYLLRLEQMVLLILQIILEMVVDIRSE